MFDQDVDRLLTNLLIEYVVLITGVHVDNKGRSRVLTDTQP